MHIVFPEPVEIDAESQRYCETLGARIYTDVPVDTPALAARLSEADVAVVSVVGIPLDAVVLASCPNLRTVIVAGSGIDRIDVVYAAAHDITVVNCPEHTVQAVAEHAITLLFTQRRRILEAANSLRDGVWDQMQLVGHEVRGVKLGIVGSGRIGSAIGRLAHALDMEVLSMDSDTSHDDFDTLLATSDVVCVCLPANDSTYHLINADRLHRMKQTALIINVGRGSTIDQEALRQALQDGTIGGAALDVFEDEHDLTAIQALATLPNVLATPHIAFNTAEAMARRGPEIIAHLKRLNVYSAER